MLLSEYNELAIPYLPSFQSIVCTVFLSPIYSYSFRSQLAVQLTYFSAYSSSQIVVNQISQYLVVRFQCALYTQLNFTLYTSFTRSSHSPRVSNQVLVYANVTQSLLYLRSLVSLCSINCHSFYIHFSSSPMSSAPFNSYLVSILSVCLQFQQSIVSQLQSILSIWSQHFIVQQSQMSYSLSPYLALTMPNHIVICNQIVRSTLST